MRLFKVLGERAQKVIDRMCGPRSSDRGVRFRTPPRWSCVCSAAYVHMPSSTPHPVLYLTTGHPGRSDRISLKMLGTSDRGVDQHEGHRRIARQVASQLENASSPPASSDADDRESVSRRLVRPRHRELGRSPLLARRFVDRGGSVEVGRLPYGKPSGDLAVISSSQHYVPAGLLGQAQLLYRHADVTTVQWEVKPSFARIGCAGLPFPGARAS